MNEQARRFVSQALNDPVWLFYQFNVRQDRADFVQVTEADYHRAAFLDQRLNLHNPPQASVPLSALQSAFDLHESEPQTAHFIFHVGHCGSTLLSRLLGELPGVFALREPLPLGILSMIRRAQCDDKPAADYERLQALVFHLVKRRFHETQVPVIKATSICGNLAQGVLATHLDTRLVFMYVSLETYLATMLRNAVRREEINDSIAINAQDLNRHLETDEFRVETLDQVQRTVVTWLAKMKALSQRQEAFADRCLWLNFDAFLDAPVARLGQVCSHLALKAEQSQLEALVAGPLMRSYAKDHQSAFSPQDRAKTLRDSRDEHADAIGSGLNWARKLAERYPIPDPDHVVSL